MYNSITIIGRLGKDAELTATQNGTSWSKFSVAVDDPMNKDKDTLWFGCNLWGKRADSLSKYLTKGTLVQVTGSIELNEYNGRSYLNVNVNSITLLSPKNDNAKNPQYDHSQRDKRTTQKTESFGGNPTNPLDYQGSASQAATVSLDDVPF